MPFDIAKLSPLEQAEVAEILWAEERAEMEGSFEAFVKAAWHVMEPTTTLVWNWHMTVLCGYLQALFDRTMRVPRLIINIPPGSSKSLCASVFWPAWIWAKEPGLRFLTSSNDKTLVMRDNVNMRTLVASDWFQGYWGEKVVPDTGQWGKDFYKNMALGFRQGVTMKGSHTGKRGDCLPAETVITTDRGPMTIREIHEEQDKPRVAAVDRGTVTWSPIVATREIEANELVELQTDGGRTIRATPGHLLGTWGRRWAEAGDLSVGERVVACGPSVRPLRIDLPQLEQDTIRSVRRTRQKGVKVYDLQVEGTHNFIADGLLVHNCQIIDDPHDAKKAFFDNEIQAGTEGWDQGMVTRVNNMEDSRRLLIMQRLRTNDLTGHLLSNKQMDWVHLIIPMEYTGEQQYDPVKDIGPEYAHLADPRRKVGELLDPIRFPASIIPGLKVTLGDYGWSGQMQQSPVPMGGGIIKKKWWRRWESMHGWCDKNPTRKRPPPLFKHVFWSWDTAFTTLDRKNNAFTAGTKWGLFFDDHDETDKLMLLDEWHGRVPYHALRKRVLEASKSDTDAHLIERKASGISLIQDLRRNKNIKVRSYDPRGDGDKEARAMLCTAHFERGMIVYPDREWAKQVIDWVTTFPSGAPPSADITDGLTQAIIYVTRQQWIRHPDDAIKDQIEEEMDEDDYAPPRRHGTYG